MSWSFEVNKENNKNPQDTYEDLTVVKLFKEGSNITIKVGGFRTSPPLTVLCTPTLTQAHWSGSK